MSSTQVTESSKPICITIRISKLKFLKNNPNNLSFKINLKLSNQFWSSSSGKKVKNSLIFNELHSFDISDKSILHISLIQDRFLISPIFLASLSIKVTTENKKSTDWYFLYNDGKLIGKVLIGLLVDEKNEPFPKFQALHGLDLEKEEVRFCKAKYLSRLKKLKSEKNDFRNNFSNVLYLLKESVVERVHKSGSVNKRVNQSEVMGKQPLRGKSRLLSVGNKGRGKHSLIT